MARIPSNAFETYLSLGPERSYGAVALKLGVTKRTVTRVATREHWQRKLEQVEKEAREKLQAKITEDMQAIDARHLKTLRVIQGKALAGLQSMPLDSGMDCVRALDLAIRQERTILGEPGERSSITIEDTIKREYQRWMGDGGASAEDDNWDAPAANGTEHDPDDDDPPP